MKREYVFPCESILGDLSVGVCRPETLNVISRFFNLSSGEVPASATGQQNRGARHLHQQRRPPGQLVQPRLEEENVADAQE